jgi:hypothetical protein
MYSLNVRSPLSGENICLFGALPVLTRTGHPPAAGTPRYAILVLATEGPVFVAADEMVE